MVKLKTRWRNIFILARRQVTLCVLPVLSLLTFIGSLAGAFPPTLVERWFARTTFPRISALAGRIADSIAISWLDVGIPVGLCLMLILVRKRSWIWLLNLISASYLIFFWSWGLNYHREPLAFRLDADPSRTDHLAIESFSRRVALEMNRLYGAARARPYNEASTRQEAITRVRRVVEVIDGTDWPSAQKIKTSWMASPWFRAAGIDGFFNPLAHEPIVSATVLDIERPFVMAHELAHVRGYPDEGDANLIATFATILSEDPTLQYSGWLNLWLYVRSRQLDALLNEGPRADLERIFERARKEQIRWINDVQRSMLDLFLKANRVEQGVRSYSQFVLLAVGTESNWERYR
jgi:hypothetical protein